MIAATATTGIVRINLENFIDVLLVVGRMAGIIAKRIAAPECRDHARQTQKGQEQISQMSDSELNSGIDREIGTASSELALDPFLDGSGNTNKDSISPLIGCYLNRL